MDETTTDYTLSRHLHTTTRPTALLFFVATVLAIVRAVDLRLLALWYGLCLPQYSGMR